LRKFVIWLPARFEITRSGLALRISSSSGEKSVASVGTSLSAGELAAVGRHELLGHAQQVVPERVVGGEREPLLALHQPLRHQRSPAGLHVHRVLALDVEHELVAALAAQLVGVGAGIDEERLGALRDLPDGERRGRRNLADDARDLVALDHALGLGGSGLRVDRVFLEELDLAAVHAARLVDLVHRHVRGLHRELAQGPQEAGAAA
jgi:hypothetical protein